jgi:hypothetical protein
MRFVSSHQGQLQVKTGDFARPGDDFAREAFATGLPTLDELAPGGALARGVVHELLWQPGDPRPGFLAALFAKAASTAPPHTAMAPQGDRLTRLIVAPDPTTSRRPIVWSDPLGRLYPPALAEMGIDLDRLLVLRPQSDQDEIWAIGECLGCRAIAAVVAAPRRLSRVQARRLQLAAEQGGSAGILLRPTGRASAEYAAATRWLIRPARGERTVQRWSVQLIHGHGGRVGDVVVVEYHRDQTHLVRATAQLADRQAPPRPARALA